MTNLLSSLCYVTRSLSLTLKESQTFALPHSPLISVVDLTAAPSFIGFLNVQSLYRSFLAMQLHLLQTHLFKSLRYQGSLQLFHYSLQKKSFRFLRSFGLRWWLYFIIIITALARHLHFQELLQFVLLPHLQIVIGSLKLVQASMSNHYRHHLELAETSLILFLLNTLPLTLHFH